MVVVTTPVFAEDYLDFDEAEARAQAEYESTLPPMDDTTEGVICSKCGVFISELPPILDGNYEPLCEDCAFD